MSNRVRAARVLGAAACAVAVASTGLATTSQADGEVGHARKGTRITVTVHYDEGKGSRCYFELLEMGTYEHKIHDAKVVTARMGSVRAVFARTNPQVWYEVSGYCFRPGVATAYEQSYRFHAVIPGLGPEPEATLPVEELDISVTRAVLRNGKVAVTAVPEGVSNNGRCVFDIRHALVDLNSEDPGTVTVHHVKVERVRSGRATTTAQLPVGQGLPLTVDVVCFDNEPGHAHTLVALDL